MAAPAASQSVLETGLRALSTAAFVGAVAVGLIGRILIGVLLGAAAIVLGVASALVTRGRSEPRGRQAPDKRR